MNAQEHYLEAVRLLALAPIDPARIAGTTDSAVIAQLGAAGPGGLSLPGLAGRLRQPVAATEQLLHQLLQAGHVTRLDTGLYGVPAPTDQRSARPTWSPETSTSTTHVLLAALGHALLACTAADLTGRGHDLITSHRLERG